MKKLVLTTLAVLVLLGFTAYAVVKYDRHKQQVKVAQTNQVTQLRAELKLHDAVNAKDLQLTQADLSAANAKHTQLCAVLKTTKAVYSPTLCQ